MPEDATDSRHDFGGNIHNRCGVRIAVSSTHGVCTVHSLPVYREPGGIDWFTDDVRGARIRSAEMPAASPATEAGRTDPSVGLTFSEGSPSSIYEDQE